ncbi:peptidoglycan-binding domain 1 protein [Calothrix sp. NIES-2100]|uniref:peptidoglycan-binding domain-containing protein n=1 Tax=Calothrix sp. NIES-2100 TaxID=1954172 RepID=UPI000B5EEBE7|nr:peptidoglycan-binding domain 1 protein [Calothrix sp. NIES-2100]
MNYKNSEIRSILNGLGYRSRINSNDPNFPISQDESDLTDQATQKAIKKFQVDYDLTVDGIVGSETNNKMQEEMNSIHQELNQLLGTSISQDQPFYGQLTINTVQQFQRNYTNPFDGLASLTVREQLYTIVKNNSTKTTQFNKTATPIA